MASCGGNAGGECSGSADHVYGNAFYEYEEYYKEKGYTRKHLNKGKSPRHEDIHKSSPTGKTNNEIEKASKKRKN